MRPTGTNAHLLFHNLQGVPSWVDRHRYTITSKGRYNVIMKQRDIKRLPPPFKSTCSLTASLKNNGFPYSDSFYQEHCFASDMFDTCDAVTDFWEQYLPSANRKIDPQFNDRNQMERTRKCLGDFLYDYRARKPCECKMAREETMYRANIMKYEDRNDSTYMTIYFDKLEISKSTELPAYNSTRFLADIGGLIGLLIGMSLLLVFEVLVCLALYAVDKTCLLSVSRNCLCNLHHRNF